MAQVGRDRAQQVALAVGEDQVLPAEAGIEPGRQLPQARGRGVPRAQIEIVRLGRLPASRARRDAAHLGGGADLLQGEPELGGHVLGIGGAAVALPGRSALGEGRVGNLGREHGAVAQGERLAPRPAEDDRAFRPLVEGAQQPGALRRAEIVEPVDADQRALQRARQGRVGDELGPLEIPRAHEHQGPAAGRRDDRVRVGAGHHHGQAGLGSQQLGDALDRRLAAGGVGVRRHTPQSRVGAHLHQAAAGAQQERGQPVGDLHRAIRERQRGVGIEQAKGPEPGKARVRAEAGQHVDAGDPLPHQQLGRQARAREAAGHVVLEVGVEAPVARVQLGRGAHRQHRAVQRVQPQALRRGRQGRIGVREGGVVGHGQSLVVGDVEPSERVVAARVALRRRSNRRADARVDEREPARRRLRRRCHATGPRPRARGCRLAARPSTVRSGARRAAG